MGCVFGSSSICPPTAPSNVWSSLRGLVSMASAACELFAAPLGGTAKTTECTPDWTRLVKLGWRTHRAVHLHPSEHFTGKVPGDLIIGLRACQFRCRPRQQYPIINRPHHALQCFTVRLVPGNIFQFIGWTWDGVTSCWCRAAASHATASLYPKATLRLYHKLIAQNNAPIQAISVRSWEMWKNSIIQRSTLGRCPSRHTVHGLNRLPRRYVGAIKSRIFSLIHHLRPDSLDAS